MLRELHIQNIALIDELAISFGEGLNVLSGETGAGKSIIVDSMNLITGSRGDRELVKHGAERAVVEALFSLEGKEAILALLEENGLPAEDGELVFCRELTQTGRNVCRVNGRLVSLSLLRELAEHLVAIHGQHQSQQILDERNHQSMLDRFAGDGSLLARVQDAYRAYEAAARKLADFEKSLGDRAARRDYLAFQAEEIAKAQLKPGEDAALEEERAVLENAEKIAEALNGARYALSGSGNALDQLRTAKKAMESIAGLSAKYGEALAVIDDSFYALEDMAYQLGDEADGVYYDEARLNAVNSRLAELDRLRRKYGATVEEILSYLAQCQEELALLDGGEEAAEQLRQQRGQRLAELEEACRALSAQRQQAAAVLEKKLAGELGDLGMKGSAFQVRFGEKPCAADGMDRVAFYITVNKGEPLKPLAKVASGGEASRIMLALKNVIAAKEDPDTIIFDEVDAGISGRMAGVVAEKLASVARERQVICVTHQPQIAAMGDRNFYISKAVRDGRTATSVEAISGDRLVWEIARLAGGAETEASFAHGSELRKNAEKAKKLLVKA